jgi:hypothetical protein
VEANLRGGNVVQVIVRKKAKMRTTRIAMRNRMTMMMKMALLMLAQCGHPLKRCCFDFDAISFLFTSFIVWRETLFPGMFGSV